MATSGDSKEQLMQAQLPYPTPWAVNGSVLQEETVAMQ